LVTCSTVIFFSFIVDFAASALDDPPSADAPSDDATRQPAQADSEASATQQAQPAPVPEQSYMGSDQCFVCHRPQTGTWSESKHAQAFTHLPDRYRGDQSCLKCHVTAFGEPGGFAAGVEKDLLMVGCESCHGPGALHIDAAKRFVLATPEDEAKIEKEMRQTITKAPADSVCIKCHITQAHQRHPAYHGQPSGLAHSALRPTFGAPAWYYPGYSVKTCGSCHYDRYKQWTLEKHSALNSNLPTKYRNNQDCAKCHTSADSVNRTPSPDGAPHFIGAACENCHGPGLEHVRFNVRLINSPSLSPSLEQAARLSMRKGKPTTSCVQCHVGESHKQHPEFEKSNGSGQAAMP
jgi:hypothetical protein